MFCLAAFGSTRHIISDHHIYSWYTLEKTARSISYVRRQEAFIVCQVIERSAKMDVGALDEVAPNATFVHCTSYERLLKTDVLIVYMYATILSYILPY